MSEEVNQQLAEAQGYSGMKGLIAQAYQMSLGKTEKDAKENRNAMKELTDAMSKGLVKPDKIFPILVDLMKQASAEGTEAARRSPSAQEDRFWNRMEKGWENFTKGGGASGIANFWNDLTGSVGAWFEENGAWLGKQFEILIQRFKVFRIGLTDLFKYLWDGENTGFVTWLAQEKGIDLSGVRVFFRELWAGTKEITTSILQTVGLLDKDGNFSIEEFKQRITKVTQHIGEAIRFAVESLKYLTEGLMYIGEILKGGVGGIGRALFDKKSPEAQFLDLATLSFGKSVSAFAQGTAQGLGAGFALVTPSDQSEGISDSNVTRNIHNIRNNQNLKNRSFVEGWAESLPQPVSSSVGVLQGIKNGVFSVLGIDPEKQKPFKALDNGQGVFPYNRSYTRQPPIGAISDEMLPFIAGGIRAPTSSSILQPDVRQSSAGFSLDAQKMAPLDINVNVKMEVSGDPEQMKLYAAEEVAKGIADRVPKLLDESFDYKFSGKMKSVITDAPLN